MTRPSWQHVIAGLFAALLIAEVAVILGLRYFVTEDGPNHLNVAVFLGRYNSSALYRHYLYAQEFPVPNLSTEVVLAALVRLLTPDVAEKLLQIGYVLALPFALLYAVRAISPERSWLALFGFMLTFTYTLHFGFYNFCFGVALFLVCVGYMLRVRTSMTAGTTIVLAVLFLLTYTTHIVPFLESVIFALTFVAWEALVDGRRDRVAGLPLRSVLSRAMRHVGPVAIAVLPGLILAAWFFISTGSGGAETYTQPARWKVLLAVLDLSWGLVSYGSREVLVCSGVALFLFALTVTILLRRSPGTRLRREDGFAVAGIVALLVVAVAPEQTASGGGFVTERLALFPCYAVLLWLAGQPFGIWWGRIAAGVATGAAIVLLLLRLPTYQALSDQVTEYQSLAPCVRANSTFLQINLWRDHWSRGMISAGDLDPLSNAAGRLAARSQGLDLDNTDAAVPFSTLHFRSDLDPTKHLQNADNGMTATPPAVDLLRYNRTSGGSVDYVLLFGRQKATTATLQDPGTRRVLSQLATAYQLVGTTRPTGLVELYRLRGQAFYTNSCPAVR